MEFKMDYYGNNDYRDYMTLRHHGILGMKWGKRNGPPYPLGASDHSASEKKAGWRKSLGGGSDSARSYKKRLNKLDQEVANSNAKMMRAQEKERKYTEKSNAAYDKGNMKKSKKYADKALDARGDKVIARGISEELTKKQWQTVAEAVNKNYNVTVSNKIRNGERAKQEVTYLLAGALGGTVIYAASNRKFKGKYQTEYKGRIVNQTPNMQVGNKFKVKENKTGEGLGSLIINPSGKKKPKTQTVHYVTADRDSKGNYTGKVRDTRVEKIGRLDGGLGAAVKIAKQARRDGTSMNEAATRMLENKVASGSASSYEKWQLEQIRKRQRR